VFGASGIWPEFLSRNAAYIATAIERESNVERCYRVRDFWKTHRDFELFRERMSADLEKFDRLIELEGLIEKQEFVGAYYEKRPGDEDEVVPG
jgi:hypothetical protein